MKSSNLDVKKINKNLIIIFFPSKKFVWDLNPYYFLTIQGLGSTIQ